MTEEITEEPLRVLLVLNVRLGPLRMPPWNHRVGQRSYAIFEHQGRTVEVTEVHGLRRWQLIVDEDGPWSRAALYGFAHAYGYTVACRVRRRALAPRGGGPRSMTWRSQRAQAKRRQLILACLDGEPRRSWEFELHLGLSHRAVMETLLVLRVEGYVQLDGQVYYRTAKPLSAFETVRVRDAAAGEGVA